MLLPGDDPRLEWPDFDDQPILFVNHFLVQPQPDEFVVSLAQVTGTPLGDSPPQALTLARVSLTRRRVNELIGILQARLEEHDRAFGAGQPA